MFLNLFIGAINGYTLGATLMGVGVFSLALSRPQMGASFQLYKIAPLVLGIYACHPWIMSKIPPSFVGLFDPVIWKIVYPFVIFFLSVALTFLLRKLRFTRWLVE